MNIKYKDFPYDKEKTNSLSGILEEKAFNYASDSTQNAKALAKAAIEFNEKIVDLLYSKGILNDDDISILVSKITLCDEDDVKVIK